MLSRVLLVKVKIIGRLVGDAHLTGSCRPCAVWVRCEFFCSGRGYRLLSLGSEGWGPETDLAVNPTLCRNISDRMR